MKKIFYFSTLILIIVISNCSDPSSFDNNDRFAIYLLKDESLTAENVSKIELSELKLKDTPSITFNDLSGYDTVNHKVYLLEDPIEYFGTNYNEILFSKYTGNPFVLIANGKRIFYGYFISLTSSYCAPNAPVIFNFDNRNSQHTFIINRGCFTESSLDVRNDERIFIALGNKII